MLISSLFYEIWVLRWAILSCIKRKRHRGRRPVRIALGICEFHLMKVILLKSCKRSSVYRDVQKRKVLNSTWESHNEYATVAIRQCRVDTRCRHNELLWTSRENIFRFTRRPNNFSEISVSQTKSNRRKTKLWFLMYLFRKRFRKRFGKRTVNIFII